MARPRVFVSSTIYDFRDLRSALRSWLTEYGYDPQLSEHNDFGKPLDQNSYEACVRVIETCDYFVLFIGARVGGMFDASNRVSITREEYRRAYALFETTGKPKIVAFVRHDLWAVVDDRHALERLLATDRALQKEIPSGGAEKIKNHPSNIVNDAEATFAFIDEVKRRDAMIKAQGGDGPLPRGNWVHSFDTFEDVIAVLRNDLRLGSARNAAVVQNLRDELVSNATDLLFHEEKQGRVPMYRYASPFRPLLFDAKWEGSVMIKRSDFGLAVFFRSIAGACGVGMTTSAIEEAILSGAFLEWSADLHTYAQTPVHRALVRLRAEIELLRRQEQFGVDADLTQRWFLEVKNGPEGPYEVETRLLVLCCGVHDRHQNILSLTRALLRALDGDKSVLDGLKLWPRTPLEGRSQPFGDEARRRASVELWLTNAFTPKD